VAVARERSFTRAARALRVAQPALSQQLRALELELGVVLIERTNRTGGLTDAGTSLLPRAERIVTLARNKSRYERPSVAAVRRLLSDELRAPATT
jgi:DNA-binding transcriptional LysR family regulator